MNELRKKHKERSTSDPAVKGDGDKLRWDLVPIEALEEVVRVFNFGAKKYEDRNWEKGMGWSRMYAAAMRHLTAFWRGETFDKETGLHHCAHAAWCCLALCHYTMYNLQFDDRPIPSEMLDAIKIDLTKLPKKQREQIRKAMGLKPEK